MNSKPILIIFLIIVLIVIGVWAYSDMQTKKSAAEVAAAEMAQVRDVVTSFGKKMQLVPLSGTKEIADTAMQENYSGLVSSELLSAWMADPANAPGRLTSSPWPDRIEISSVVKNANGSYAVAGNVIEITSVELENGGIAATYPVSITVSKINGNWVISAFAKGTYQ
ncbi:MAG: hypothetical protein WC520_00225 [Candidatus Paceibacterota bacterium]